MAGGAQMKRCPICSAVTFDDAEICYGCLHHFEKEGDDTESENSAAGFLADALAESTLPIAGTSWRTRADMEVFDDGKTVVFHLEVPLTDSGDDCSAGLVLDRDV